MRICLILEGCYPYVHGGVSTWMHQYIKEMKEHEFVLWVIGAHAEDKGKFVYELPENVVEVKEVFLDDALHVKDTGKLLHIFTREEQDSLRELMDCGRPDWEVLFRLYHDKKINPMSFLKSEEFLEILEKSCLEKYPYTAFADAFHTMRSMLLPVLYLLGSEVPQADVYHAICTGYGGMLACLGGYVYQKKVLLTEHGIYTREREEEIIRAKWVMATYKKQWISFFYMLSDIRNRLFLRNLIQNIRCHIHHRFDTFGRNIGTGIHHEYEAEQHNRKHGMKKIFHKRHQLSHLQRALIDHLACNKIDGNCRNIH